MEMTAMNKLFAEMEAEALAAFGAIGLQAPQVRLARTAGMRYIGQFHEEETEVLGGATKVYDGDRLLAGNVIAGLAVFEETTTTVAVPEGLRCQVDELRATG